MNETIYFCLFINLQLDLIIYGIYHTIRVRTIFVLTLKKY